MNKYQEVLDYFCDHCMEFEECYDWVEDSRGKYIHIGKETLKEKKDILQELVDKATPKKPNIDILNVRCPNCKYELGREFAFFGAAGLLGTDHCPNCGQALKWKEEDGDAK